MSASAALRAFWGCGLIIALMPASQAADSTVERIVPDVAALAGQPLTRLPAPPAWVDLPPGPAWTVAQVAADFRAATAKPPTIIYVRTEFVRPDYRWFLAYVKWFRGLHRPLHMEYAEDVFDCDKYSRCFVAFANLLAEKSGESRAPLCVGWATVFNDRTFGGVAAGGRHAVVIVNTSEGLIVVEPQNGTVIPLRDYPNRDTLSAFYL
jgi:hypothetical protein